MKEAKILLVEDDPVYRMLVEKSLSDWGRLLAAKCDSGEEALKLAAAESFNLVLMDVDLAGKLDGMETARLLWENHQLPTVFLTANSGREMVERAKSAEPYAYLVKPFQPLTLCSTVETALHKARMEAERRRLLNELEEAMEHIKVLRGLLPICASCKKIRDEAGLWQAIEVYIRDHSEADFSHSICPDCMRKLYPDLADELYDKEINEKKVGLPVTE